MYSIFSRQWPLLVPLIFAAASQAQAQVPAQAQAQAQDGRANTPQYQSALQNYKPFADEKIVPWKQSNDTVREVGGWRAYAREAAQPADPEGQSGHQGHHPAQQGGKP
jgi:hypothetical protein